MTSAKQQPRRTAAIIGAGNIGSQLGPHLARMAGIDRIIIVDPDSYSQSNLRCQSITADDVGQPKAAVLARRLREIRTDGNLQVSSIVDRVENAPWGLFRDALMCGCVDSKAARASINIIGWRMGATIIDGGIRADGHLARVNVHVPGPEASCLGCSWSARDYEMIGQIFGCDGQVREAPPSGASSSLGGLAASLMALEVEKLVEGRMAESLAGRQVMIEAAHYQQYVNVLRPNPACRFDHSIAEVVQTSAATLGELVEAARPVICDGPASIRMEGKSWDRQLACAQCGTNRRVLRLQGRGSAGSRCRRCGGELRPVGFFSLPRISFGDSHRWNARGLARLGLRSGDVVCVSGEAGEAWFELMAVRAARLEV